MTHRIMAELDGTTPLEDCDWVFGYACGCPYGPSSDGTIPLALGNTP